jgi:hypothetical protein
MRISSLCRRPHPHYVNLGDGNASAVRMMLSLPPDFEYNRRFGASPAMNCAATAGAPARGQTVTCTYGASYPPGDNGTIAPGLNVLPGAATQSPLVASISDDGVSGPSLPQCLADPADPDPMIGCGRAPLSVSPWIFCNGFETLPHSCGQPQLFA